MRRLRLAAALACAACVQAGNVGVDPRVELFSIVFRLAGYSEYSQGRVPVYNQAVDAWFGPYRDHQAVRIARDLRNAVALDAIMSLAVHVTDTDTLVERPSSALDSRWSGRTGPFLEAVRRFVSDTRFRDFLLSQQPLYDVANERLRALADEQLDLTWFSRFFGPRPVRLNLVPGLLNGFSSYGVRCVEPDAEDVFAITGVVETDPQGLPLFSPGVVSTAVHEFTHSYANPLVDLYGAQLDRAGDRLLEAVRPQMQQQGYARGRTVLYESLVRASGARYAAEKKGPAGADQSILYEHARSFLWTGELSKLLTEYERSRETYPTLESFMPRVVTFFDEASNAPASMPARYEQSRPNVVEVSVPEGAIDVDPRLREIVVRFDRRMMRTSSVVPRIPDSFPQVLGAAFDESAQVCTISVGLQPGRSYELNLNATGEGWFGSAEGVALKPYTIWFSTRAAERRAAPRRPGPGRVPAGRVN
jgi:hypothetical protein